MSLKQTIDEAGKKFNDRVQAFQKKMDADIQRARQELARNSAQMELGLQRLRQGMATLGRSFQDVQDQMTEAKRQMDTLDKKLKLRHGEVNGIKDDIDGWKG